MKALLYADRQVLQILETRAFDRLPNGRWQFAEGRSIADGVALRLIAHGRAKKVGDQLMIRRKKPLLRPTSRMQIGEQI